VNVVNVVVNVVIVIAVVVVNVIVESEQKDMVISLQIIVTFSSMIR
jgi:hypothetical protein